MHNLLTTVLQFGLSINYGPPDTSRSFRRKEEMKLRPGHLFGCTLKTYVGSELRLTETLCPPGLRAPRHSHELFLFCFMIEGGFSEATIVTPLIDVKVGSKLF